ncbi:MAG: 4-hydroxythreonine-4-phosphate dehydrogenase PdxA [Verrucomicrobiota bacterium]|nr:4-hydroxythreonine-4-phosphate dehydrogenase PdxA [Verrucomicrobiota bacterium]
MKHPVIAITMGDPSGVGPEICLKALNNPKLLRVCSPIVFGDVDVLKQCAKRLGLAWTCSVLNQRDPEQLHHVDGPTVLHLPNLEPDGWQPGTANARTGKASFHYIQEAISAALAGEVSAVTTAPINKEALHKAGIPYPGHTEMFAARAGSDRWCMMQYSETITCTFVTVHVGLAEVPQLLNKERILQVIELSAENLYRIRRKKPRLVVCGLNPHAGEHGLFGNQEEEHHIIPAVEAARRQGIDVEGPLPPDTAFLPWRREKTDAFVCMYHDQGHIPLKALAFDTAVNTTLGLSIVRTSVDHGTALDIAWQGKANPGSLFKAIELAAHMAHPTALNKSIS